MSNRGTILIPGAGWEQASLARRATDEGWHVIAAGPANSPVADIATSFAEADSRDLDRLLRLAQEHQIDAVVSDQCDYSRYAQAWLSQRLGLPGPTITSVAPTVNKVWLRDIMAGRDVPQPRYRSARSLSEAEHAIDTVGLPAIVKPVDNRGSFGVVRVDNTDELANAVFDALANSHSRQLIIEQFIHGTVLTVDGAYLPSGHIVLGVASKKQVSGARQVAMEIAYPALVREPARNAAECVAHEVARALADLGASGLTHTELLWDGEVAWLIETANRGGGVNTSATILPAHSGYDVNGLLLAEASASPAPEVPNDRHNPACILRFLSLAPGVISSITGLDDVRGHIGVIEADLWVGEGSEVREVANATNRNGYVIVVGNTYQVAERRAHEALQRLTIIY